MTVTCETDYPFEETIRLTITSDRRTRFPLYLRIPNWTTEANITVSGHEPEEVSGAGFVILEGPWQGATEITLQFAMEIETEKRTNGAVTVRCGPLVYALDVGATWRQIGGALPHADWELLPNDDWNYGLMIEKESGELWLELMETRVAEAPFDSQEPPSVILSMGRQIPDWGLEHGVAAEPPPSPAKAVGAVTEMRLIPYGCAKLRLTEIPTVRED